MPSIRDKAWLRRILLVIGLGVVIVPTAFTLVTVFSVSSPSSSGAQALFWNILGSLIRDVFPIALIIGYLTRPRRMAGAYWLIPVYFGLNALAALMPVVRAFVMDPEASTPPDIGRYALTSVLIPIVYAIVLWVLRPAPPGESQQPLVAKEPAV